MLVILGTQKEEARVTPPLRELLRGGAREVGLVGAEDARHVVLPHAQELARCVVLVGLLPEEKKEVHPSIYTNSRSTAHAADMLSNKNDDNNNNS